MTNYLRDNTPRRIIGSREKKSRRSYAIFVILLLSMLLFFGRHFLSTQLVGLVSPLWSIENKIQSWIAPLVFPWAEKIELQNANIYLSRMIEEKSLEVQRLNLILDEYSDITSLFSEEDLSKRNPEQGGTLATILARPPTSPFDTLIVNLGENSGATVGDLVYGPGGIVLGEISELYPRSSKVSLFSAPGKEHRGFIEDLGPLTLTGLGGGNFTAQFPKGGSISTTTFVTLEGTENIMAEVGTTTITEGDSFQKIYARVPINIQALKWVRILHHE